MEIPHQSCVLDLPLIAPDDWDVWWQFWEKREPLEIIGTGRNPDGFWIGLDIYRSANYDPKAWKYLARYEDATKIFPKMFETIALIPAKIDLIRVVSSQANFYAHRDWVKPTVSLRTMLWDQNPEPTFYYESKPGAERIYQLLPKESNSWVYLDYGIKHGSEYHYNFSKILLMYRCEWDWPRFSDLVARSAQKFPEFCVPRNE